MNRKHDHRCICPSARDLRGAVGIVLEDGFLFIAAGGDVIDSTCVFDAEGAGLAGTLAQKRENIKRPDPNNFNIANFDRSFSTA
jgi:hypothetical protein